MFEETDSVFNTKTSQFPVKDFLPILRNLEFTYVCGKITTGLTVITET
jgi:hypothetical protein